MRLKIRMAAMCSGLALFLMTGFPVVSSGQISLKVTLPISQALRYEPVMANVAIVNNTGQMISFGTGSSLPQFRFDIEKSGGGIVSRRNAEPLISGISIMPGETHTFEIMLSRYYHIQDIGLYTIKAVVEWNSVGYASAGVYLEVAQGFELARMKAGIPGDKGAVRTYVLEYLQRERGEDLYLRIRDDRGKVICGMFNLGRIVRVRKPALQIDEAGNVHVLFQTIGMGYIHTAYTPYGVRLFSDNIAGGKVQVSLKELPSGQVTVVKEELHPETQPSLFP